jgi:D-alanine-D-alanine ligase-like ATP-grasp enzyme
MDKIVLVQPFFRGMDVRVVVFDGAPVAAYRRIPPVLIGDDRHSIQLLLEGFYAARDHAGPERRLPDRDEATARLARREGGLQRVPRSGEHVPLTDAANVASGADLVDLSRTIPADVPALAVEAARIAGLRWAGVDFQVDLGSEPSSSVHVQTDRTADRDGRRDGERVVLEINSAPELDGFASLGDNQLTLVEHLYESILLEIAR